MSHCVCARCYKDPYKLYCTLTFICECGALQKITYASNGGGIVGHDDGYQCTECGCYYKHAYKIEDDQEWVKHLFYIDHPPCPEGVS